MFVKNIREIHVEPTTVCQAECSMCARTVLDYHNNKLKNTELSLKKFQSLTEHLIKDLQKILFCGTLGDPASCIELLDIIDWTQSVNPNITIGINTNGAIRNTDWWKQLAKKINKNIYSYVVFSIDGLENTNHIYRKKVVWKKLIENVQAYISAGGVAQWDMLVFDHNKHQVEKAKQLAYDMGFRAFRTKVSNRFSFHTVDVLPPDQIMPAVEEEPFSCMAKDTNSVYLSAAGVWYPCCYIHDEHVRYIDNTWGNTLKLIDDRESCWQELELSTRTNPLPVCKKSCGSTLRKGQWKTEVFFS
jgi:MoaA/NifB/PqqE/SkfB family radical SAM enzyme